MKLERNTLKQRMEQLLQEADEHDIELLDIFLGALERKRQPASHLPPSCLRDLLQYEEKLLDDGAYQITIPVTSVTQNIFGAVHGGIIATILDTTMGYVLNHELVPKGQGVVTTEMKVNYLLPGDGKHLRCVAQTVHRGRKLCVVEGKLYNDRDELIAIATGSFYIFTKR
ncbi:PaaI family thioesterase [Ectobacillus ponti]|uniref:PaaI family thioesterase n=1 Tax=Ectobacillus ponti TaxID=2961894 RepID=A0AA41X2Z4_9BACI|nr:PaaI family thioesterase [Ectobacillus ponti]MCP8967986.1 PaaI family thioesterase [Ectobacillus ponti]